MTEFRKTFIVMLGVCLVAFGGAFASAATLSVVGVDGTTADGWRTTGLAKPLDSNGDGVYGSDGYFLAIDQAPGDVGHTYATVSLIPPLDIAGNYEGSSAAAYQGVIDDPTQTGVGPVPNITMGDWWLDPPDPEQDFFSIVLTADASFRLGVVGDQVPDHPNHAGLRGESPAGIRVRGPGVDSGVIDMMATKDTLVDYAFVDISGNLGDEFIVSGTFDPDWSATAMAGVTFDPPVPEPSSLLLLVMGVLGLAVCRRRR